MIKHINSKLEANQFRQRNGFGDTEPIRLKSLLLKLGVLTVFNPLSEKFSGMAIKQKDYRFMLVNCQHTLGRQHFTICHELYHLFVQKEFQYQTCKTGLFQKQSDPIERKADLFAVHLLLPENGILELIPSNERKKDKISLASILKIEQYYSSSRTALCYRLEEIGLTSKNYIEQFRKGVIKGARNYGYSTNLYEKGNNCTQTIGDYGEIMKKLFDNEFISESHYISLMGDIQVDVEEQYNEERLDEAF